MPKTPKPFPPSSRIDIVPISNLSMVRTTVLLRRTRHILHPVTSLSSSGNVVHMANLWPGSIIAPLVIDSNLLRNPDPIL